VPRRGRGGKYWFDGDGDRVIVPRCHRNFTCAPTAYGTYNNAGEKLLGSTHGDPLVIPVARGSRAETGLREPVI
jgi:hypothetical protein